MLLALPPASLAVTACVSQGLRIAAACEALWEKHCVGRWLHPHKHLRQGAAETHLLTALLCWQVCSAISRQTKACYAYCLHSQIMKY